MCAVRLEPEATPCVVVGVEGSPSSVTAVLYAAAEACRREVALRAVGVYAYGASRSAALLVLGSDTHRLLWRLAEGSVLPAMTHHVHVPTVIVPQGWRA